MAIVTADTYGEAFSAISLYNHLTVDTETTGLDTHKGARLCGISVLAGQNSYYLPWRHGEGPNLPFEYLAPFIEMLFTKTLTGWNSKFDLKILLADAPASCAPPKKFEDVMLAAHLMNENEVTFKLKELGAKYIGGDVRDEEKELGALLKERNLGKGQMWKLPASLVNEYAEQDVIITKALRDFYDKHLRIWQLYDLWQELNDYMQVIMRLELWGLQLDTAMIEYRIEEAKRMAGASLQKLAEIAGYPVNPNSSPQVCGLLGVPSSAADILETLDHPAAPYILDARRWSKVNGTYYEAFRSEMGPDGVLHPNLNQIGTVTGRFSCSKPNLQAIPRDDDKEEVQQKEAKSYVKTVFTARPGYVFVQADYKQAEVYLGAHYANAVKMIELLRSGVDVHKATADMLSALGHPVPRSAAKRLNFAQQYGIGPATLRERLWLDAKLRVTEQEAAQYIKAYNSVHPQMKQLYYRAEARAKQNGYIRMWTGRTRHYNGREWDTKDGKGSPEHKASSNLIQGGVAEVMRVASMEIHKRLSGADVHQNLHVHDSIEMEIPEDPRVMKELIPEILDCMTSTKLFPFTVPLRVDLEVGKRWSEVKPWRAE